MRISGNSVIESIKKLIEMLTFTSILHTFVEYSKILKIRGLVGFQKQGHVYNIRQMTFFNMFAIDFMLLGHFYTIKFRLS